MTLKTIAMPLPTLVRPERSAHAAIRGYLYQTCLGVLRWLDLEKDEILVVEGNEDLDRLLLDGTTVHEQVKAYGGRLGVRDRAVRDSLRAFAVTYAALRQDDVDRRFVFTTTAEKRRSRRGALDVVEAWDDPERRDEIVAELRGLLPKENDEHVERALAWLDAESNRWLTFIDAVEWHFEAESLDGVRAEVEDKLRERGLVPTAAHVDHLIAELLAASAQTDVVQRSRTPQDLEDFLRATDEQLARWSATPRAVALRAVFDEVAELGRLLHDGTRELRPDPSPGHLLTAAHEVVPFHTQLRCAELDELATWCDHEARASVWLWTGEGGAGKSRLMIEWCRQLRGQGWHAGFLHRHLRIDVDRLVEGKAPRLAVVDYAETQQDVVRALLYHAATTLHRPRCRVLLLARREADWWRILREGDADIEELIASSPEPRRLEAPDTGRSEFFREAAAAFSEATERSVSEVSDPELERAGLDRVLYLHMAALAAIGGERIEDASDALAKTLDHERHYWHREVEGLGLDRSLASHLQEAIGPALAALTLVGGTTSEGETRELVERVTEVSAARRDLGKTLLRFLHRIYGESKGVYLGLEPDLLGEELVASSLGDEPSLLDCVIEVADAAGRASTLTVLTRLASRRPEEERWLVRAFEGHLEELAETALAVAVEVGDPIGRVLASFVSSASGELAERLMKRCDADAYQRSVPLSEVACEATRRSLKVYRESWQKPGNMQLLWRMTTMLGVRLGALGRRQEALKVTSESVEITRRLVEAQPEAFLPDLATSLNNLGNRLSDLGRCQEALEAVREAIEIRRRLATSLPDAVLPDLAQNLSNLGVLLSALGRHEEALEASQEATDIRRGLAKSRPEAFLPDLAQSLNNLGSDLSDLGRNKKALEATREAVRIRRRLVAERPDVFLPDLAASLNNLGVFLSALGRREEALEVTREAVDVVRPLAAARPDAFLPDLALYLNSLSSRLGALVQYEDALRAVREAVKIRRRLAASQPDAFLPTLANSLNSLGEMLSELDRHAEAFVAQEEAILTLAPFFERLQDAFAERMKTTVDNYQSTAANAGRLVDDELLSPILAKLKRLDEDD